MIVEEVAKIYIIHSRSHSALILNIWNHIKITDVQHFNHQNPQWVTIWRFLNTSILYYYIFDFAEIIARDHVQKNPKANSIALLGGRGTHVACMKTQKNVNGLTKAVFPTNDGENFQISSWNRIRSLLIAFNLGRKPVCGKMLTIFVWIQMVWNLHPSRRASVISPRPANSFRK